MEVGCSISTTPESITLVGGGGVGGGRGVMEGHNGTKVCGGSREGWQWGAFPVVAESGGAATDGTPLFWDFQRA